MAQSVPYTHASLFGVREQAAAALRQVAEGLEKLSQLAQQPALATYLRNTSVINPACELSGEQSAEIADIVLGVLQQLQPQQTASLARLGETTLNLRRTPAVIEGFYRSKGAGPEAHFLFELWDVGFHPKQIAEYVLFRQLRRPGLLQAERQAIIDDGAERIEDRLSDYRKVLQPRWRGISGEQKHPPEEFVYLAFSVHVEPYSQLAVHRGSRDGMPGFSWHSSPLDSNGTPTEPPPWETAGSPA